MHNSFLISLVVFIVFKEHIFNDAVHVRWINAVCGSDNKTFLLQSCRLRAVQRNKTLLRFTGTFLHTVHDLRCHVQLMKRANGYKPFLYNITFDICEFQRKHNNPVINMMYNIFRNYSNLNHTCPYMGPVIVKDLYLKPELFPLPWPTGEYGVLMTWTFNRKTQAYANFYFEFIEDM